MAAYFLHSHREIVLCHITDFLSFEHIEKIWKTNQNKCSIFYHTSYSEIFRETFDLKVMYNLIICKARNLPVTRVFIKIHSTHFHGDETKQIEIIEEIQHGRLKKTEFFKNPNSQYFFAKISGIGPWLSRINWCEGRWCGSTCIVRC